MKKKPPVDMYSGVQVIEINSVVINEVYAAGYIEVPDKRLVWYPNEYIYLKADDAESKGAICRVSKDSKTLQLIRDKDLKAFGLRARNKEQTMALAGLLDENVPLCILTGKAGCGKSLLALAAALQKMEEKKYDRIILTKPMSQVGRYDLGALPGGLEEKFNPYLENYITNLQQLVGNNRYTTTDLIAMYKIQTFPMQLLRGVSWVKSLILADEVQTCDRHEMLTLGTRIGEGSKLIVMGDLGQRDERILREDTGLYKMVNSEEMKRSPLVSHINLIKGERSSLCELVASVLEE